MNLLTYFVENQQKNQSGCGLRAKFRSNYAQCCEKSKEAGNINKFFSYLLKQKAVVVQGLKWKFKANIARSPTFEGRLGPYFCPIWVENGKKLIVFKNFTLVSLKVKKLII